MNFTKKQEGYYFLRFSRGEEIYQGITEFCEREGIANALVHAIGALRDTELGYYYLSTKQYSWKTFEGDFELVSSVGNITLLEGKPFLHMHVVLSDTDFQAYGGHLRKALAGATCEVIIKALNDTPLVSREKDEQIGLNLWNCRKGQN